MKRYRLTLLLGLTTALACYFGYSFQMMAYWSAEHGMFWYWIGAVLSYLCSAAALILFFIDVKTERELTVLERIIDGWVMAVGFFAVILNILWTTFIIAWMG
ncbi:hypothetical protein [Sporolactobacillus terrae]|uniref:Uncharacterized protein n=1 Tax=Sporolactobacillus terrae TaxID=269673 RepID=A0A410D5B8_9BACL|nr:hypothetical protein [Sporolactobacillus terrae]QAA21308.1 hypothetical protein C0674_00875 [Sporolactobacillus terrae]QAA24280.1 hypothetical protein C0679_00855 [Sporolactobacillus terrae]UAK16084.1 hypothetical protein K7399_14055 [Sporolactobacillus terrae]BBN97522.1 hypothetical protein St703_02270 [Sporolactobacillus terrae]